MSPLFRPRHNTLAQISLFVVAAGAAGVPLSLMLYARTPYARGMQDPVEQPIQFDHRHHTRDEGIDCRYCHNTVDKSPAASVPQTQLCLNCHSQVWNKSPLLEPVRESFFQNKPIKWNRVYQLPEFVYFNHSIHVNKGVGCESCHGRVDHMPLMWRESSLNMEWCLSCHRDPARFVRPRDKVFTMGFDPEKASPPATQAELGSKLVADYRVQSLTTCSTCHR
jgi:hypothetical protein